MPKVYCLDIGLACHRGATTVGGERYLNLLDQKLAG